jgi:hypothetical protein
LEFSFCELYIRPPDIPRIKGKEGTLIKKTLLILGYGDFGILNTSPNCKSSKITTGGWCKGDSQKTDC